jgi:6-phosphogluconolactonase
VLAGGDTPRRVYERLRAADTNWARWQIYFGDERCLPVTDPGRNSRMAADAWLEHVPIPAMQVHTIAAERGAAEGGAAARVMLRGIGDFDLVLLGLGEDGHTASLFPGHDWGEAQDAPDALAVLDAPKPPSQRVSLSAARLSRAREVLVLIHGESKREAVSRWRAGERLPIVAVRPARGMDVLLTSTLLVASAP